MIKLHKLKFIPLIVQKNLRRNVSSTESKKIFKKSDHYFSDYHLVNQIEHESGAIKNVPQWYRLGIVKVLATFTTFLLVGAQISKSGTRFLEENDIFKPDDDDEDDEDNFN